MYYYIVLLIGKNDEIGKDAIEKLLSVLDDMPIPTRDDDKPFMMPIENIYQIKGIGTVATGRVERGKVKVGQQCEIVGLIDKPTKVNVAGVEMFQKSVKEGQTGDNLGLSIKGADKKTVRRGQFIVDQGSGKTNKEFKASCYFLTPDEGGRTKPIKGGYKPSFFFKTANITGEIGGLIDRDVIMPGDNCEIQVKFELPGVIWPQLRFAIREGGHTVAVGVISEILD